MSDLFREFEELFDQGVEDLLELVRELEGRAEGGGSRADVQSTSRHYSNSPTSGSRVHSNRTATASASTSTGNVIVKPSVSVRGVGGLSEVLRELRELVEIPLKRSDLLTKLGLEPTRGVLLVGPPGTGKTLTARALAEELGVNYIAIVGPEVMGKYYGEAEARLRHLFEKACRFAPCILFIDEIDSLAPIAPKWKARSKSEWSLNC